MQPGIASRDSLGGSDLTTDPTLRLLLGGEADVSPIETLSPPKSP